MAKSPGTKGTVGKVGVRVVPDTSKFPEELKAKLEKLEKQLKIEIPVDLDTKEAAAQYKALKERLEAQHIKAKVDIDQSALSRVSKSLGSISRSSRDLNVFAGIANSLRSVGDSADRAAQSVIRMRQAAVAAVAQTAQWAGHMLRLALRVENARKAWVGMSKAVTAVGNGIRKIPDLARLSRELASSAAWAARLTGARVVGGMVNFSKALVSAKTYSNAFYKSMEGVAKFGARTADAVDSLGRKLRNISFSGIVNGARNATAAVGRFGKTMARGVGKGIDATIGGIGKAISGVFSGAAGIFDKIGSAIGGAVGKLGEMGRTAWIVVGVLLIIAPLVGLIAGLIAGLPSLVAAFGAGVAAVALGWDGIKKAAGALKPEIDGLKKSLSDTFEKGLAPVFKELKGIFPALKTGLNQVAQGLIPLAKAFTDVVTSGTGMRQIQDILANTGKFFTALQPMVTSFTQAFLTLADVGAKNFGILSGVLNTFAANFNTIVNNLSSSGALGAALQGLGQVFGALLDMFNRLFAAGVQAMGQLGGPLSVFIKGFTDLIVALMPILTALTSLFANVAGTLMSVLAPVFAALAPSISLLADTLGRLLVGALQALAPIITPLAKILNEVLMVALQAIQPIIQPLVDLMTRLGEVIGGVLTEAMTWISPLLQQMGQLFADLMKAVAPLLPLIGDLVEAGMKLFLDILKAIMPPLIELAQMIFPLLADIIKEVTPIIQEIVDAFKPLIPIISDVVKQIVEAMIPVMKQIMEVVKEVWPSIKEIIEGALNVIKGIIKLVMGIIKGDWSQAWEGLKQILKGAWDMIKGAVKAGIDGVVGFVKNIPGAILDALGNLGKLLWNAGKAILDGLLKGLKAAWEGVKNFVSGIGSWISDHKGPIEYDRRLLIPHGKAIMAGLHEGLEKNFRQVQALTGGMAERIAKSFNGKGIGSAWADAVKDGTPDAVRSVEDLMGQVNKAANVEWQGVVASDGFGSVGDQVAEALDGWSIQMDSNGLLKLVDKARIRKGRR